MTSKSKHKCKILLAGEQVTAYGVEIKGFDHFGAMAYKEDGHALVKALTAHGHDVTWMRTCHVAASFPEKASELDPYDVVILSDVGSNSLLFHPDMLAQSIRHPDRLKLLRDYVRRGKGLVMVGGWMSFAGIDGKARYHDTYLEEALPVTCLPYDDRKERPAGVTPVVKNSGHPVLKGIPAAWPFFLGYNQVIPKNGSVSLLQVGDDPLLSIWSYGKGRSAAFTSDCAPHWGPSAFLKWKGYGLFWNNLVLWVSQKTREP